MPRQNATPSDPRPDRAGRHKIELRPLASLRVDPRNPRQHPPGQIEKLMRSIAEFGWTVPILVDGADLVIAGNGRLVAARRLGLETAPVIVVDDLTPAARRAYQLADNRIPLDGVWDEELLALEMQDLRLSEFDLDLTGFESVEVDRLLAELQSEDEGSGLEDLAPEPPERPVTEAGDVWLLGGHRLLCGDATQPESIERALDGSLADMVFTDPPYNVDYQGGPTTARRPMANDDLREDFDGFLLAACANMLAVTKGALYICMSSAELHRLQRIFGEAGGHWSTFIIWAKNHFTLGRADYQRQYEPILYGWREGTDRFWCGVRDQGDVWFIDKPQVNDLHPTMRPVALVKRAIRNSSKSRDIVLDPFAGSGSTAIACETAGRMARLIEIDPGYCDVIVRRWQDYTGNQAVLEEGGLLLAEAKEARHGAGA